MVKYIRTNYEAFVILSKYSLLLFDLLFNILFNLFLQLYLFQSLFLYFLAFFVVGDGLGLFAVD